MSMFTKNMPYMKHVYRLANQQGIHFVNIEGTIYKINVYDNMLVVIHPQLGLLYREKILR